MSDRFGILRPTKDSSLDDKQILELDDELSGKATKIFRLLDVEFSQSLKDAHDMFLRVASLKK